MPRPGIIRKTQLRSPVTAVPTPYVDQNGTGYLYVAAGGPTSGPDGCWALNIIPQTTNTSGSNKRIFRTTARSIIGQVDDEIRVVIRDTAGTVVWQVDTNANVLSVGVPVLVHVNVHLETGLSTAELFINDSQPSLSVTTAINDGNLSIDHAAATFLFADNAAGSSICDLQVSDYFFDATQTISNSTFWNGGVRPDFTTIGSPWALLRAEQGASAWNSGTNLGSGPTFTVGSATFTDV